MIRHYEGDLTWRESFHWSAARPVLWMMLRHLVAVSCLYVMVASQGQHLPGLVGLSFFAVPPVVVLWIYERIRDRRIVIDIDESGLRIERHSRSVVVERCSWNEFAQHRLSGAQVADDSILVPMVNANGQETYFHVPTHVFGSPLERHAFIQNFQNRVAACVQELCGPPMEWIDISQSQDQHFANSEFSRMWYLFGVRAIALCILLMAATQLGIFNDGMVTWGIAATISGMCGVLLLMPDRLLLKFTGYVPRDSGFWRRIIADEDGISQQWRPFDAYDPIHKPVVLRWSELSASGVCEESAGGFLLQYPHRNGRIPNRSCWMPKSMLDATGQTEKFRELVQRKMARSPVVDQSRSGNQTLPAPGI